MRSSITGVVVSLVLAAGLGGCGSDEAEPVKPEAAVPAAKTPVATAPKPATAPMDQAKKAAPGVPNLEDVARELVNPDPEVRIDALSGLDVDEPGDIKLLRRALMEDGESEVRVEAADLLSYSDSPRALSALKEALADPEPNVVVAAIEALEYAGDENIIPDLRPLLSHRDAEVRERAQEAIEYLE